jgi:hypothetical protein
LILPGDLGAHETGVSVRANAHEEVKKSFCQTGLQPLRMLAGFLFEQGLKWCDMN